MTVDVDHHLLLVCHNQLWFSMLLPGIIRLLLLFSELLMLYYRCCHTVAPLRPGSRWQVYFIIWSGGFICQSATLYQQLSRDCRETIITKLFDLGLFAGWLAMISRSVALSWSVYGMFVITILWACAWKPTSRTSIKSINSRNSSDVNNCVLSLSGRPPAFLPVTLSHPSGRGQIDVIRNSLDSVESLNIIL